VSLRRLPSRRGTRLRDPRAAAAGEISARRWESFRKLRAELEHESALGRRARR
jgi:hypothetical protein